ncbi:hypothetical protein LB506_006951, partial [Fusarium annulatum]
IHGLILWSRYTQGRSPFSVCANGFVRHLCQRDLYCFSSRSLSSEQLECPSRNDPSLSSIHGLSHRHGGVPAGSSIFSVCSSMQLRDATIVLSRYRVENSIPIMTMKAREEGFMGPGLYIRIRLKRLIQAKIEIA